MTPEDVIWTFETLRSQGRIRCYRSYYADVTKVEKRASAASGSPSRSADNRELPQILGQMPVLSKAYWSSARFREDDARAAARQRPLQDRSGRSRPLDHLSPRRRLLGQRICRSTTGRYNFDMIRYDYYRDPTIALEAFKAGQYDIRVENVVEELGDRLRQPGAASRA